MPTDDYLNYTAEYRAQAKSNPQLNRLADALAKSLEPSRLNKTLRSMPAAQRMGIGSVAIEMVMGLAWNFTVIGAAAAIGGILFGVAGSEVPVVGTAAGVEFGVMLGSTIANMALTGFGLAQSAQMIGYIMGLASVPLESATRTLWANGSVEAAANLFAEGWCTIMLAIIPIVIMIVMHKGSKALGGRINKLQRLNTFLKGLPKPVLNWASLRVARMSGFGAAEFHAMKAMSMGRLLLVRTGNPKRASFVGRLLEGKGIEVKAKTLRSGPHEGYVALDATDLGKLMKNYKLETLAGGKQRLNKNAGASGDMHGFTVEPISVDGNLRYLLRDARGQPLTGDIDRLAIMAFRQGGGVDKGVRLPPTLENIGKMADDPAEISWWNRTFNGYTGRNRVNIDSAMHGPSNTFLNAETRMSRWNADSNEQLLLFSNGQAFELSWNEMIQFMEANASMGTTPVFSAVP